MSKQNGLSVGWTICELKDIADIVMGQSPPSAAYNEDGRGLPFFQGKAEFTALFPVVRKWCSAPAKIAEAGDVLLSVRAPVGPTNLAPSRSCIGRGLAAVRAFGGIEQRYILYAIRAFRIDLSDLATGTTFEAVTGDVVRSFRIPVAPQAEQRRIVAFIEEQFSRLDAGVAALERARANLKRYRTAVLRAAVEGRLTEDWREENPDAEPASELLERILKERRERWEQDQLAAYEKKGNKPPKNWQAKYKEPVGPDTEGLPKLPEGWCWTSIEQLGNVIGGLTKNQQRVSLPVRLPYLRVANIYANELRLENIEEIGVRENELGRSLLQKDDLLVVEGNGSPDQIGRVALWDGSIDPCVHQNHLIKVRFVARALGKLVLHWLLSVSGREHIKRVASSTSGLYTLSISKVQALPVPLPPLTEQEEITAEIERRLSILREVEAQIEADLKRASRLRQSILKRAFEGRLVPQDPSDEPASVLLERVRRERAETEKKPRRVARERIAGTSRVQGGEQPNLF